MNFPKRPLELYTYSSDKSIRTKKWQEILSSQHCRYLDAKCDKIRKSQPNVTIGTCVMGHQGQPMIICPHRFLQRRQIFLDTLHLLNDHVPGNQLHVVPEITIPGGTVDYFVVSVHRGEIKDYVGLEIQALDTAGSVWQARQKLINDVLTIPVDIGRGKIVSINWKMTAKTILVQLHHKVETLELLDKKMVLVIQDVFHNYITKNFSTQRLQAAHSSDSTHFHIYTLEQRNDDRFLLELTARRSTTAKGVEEMLGMRHEAKISEEELKDKIRAKISEQTLLRI
ncbi:MAG: NotI family restriction endonuclease [Ardenticatenaceae bacterium]